MAASSTISSPAVSVSHRSRAPLPERGGDHLEQRKLEQLHLLAEHQREQEVERALEEVQLDRLLEGVGRRHPVAGA